MTDVTPTGRSGLNAMLQALLCEGWSRAALAWALAWGVTLGIFPILGVSTVACGLAALIGKLNQAVVQGANYLVAPLKLALILPCVRLGETLWPTDRPFSLSIAELQQLFAGAPLDTLRTFAVSFGHAAIGWLVLAPLVLLITQTVARILLRSARTRGPRQKTHQALTHTPTGNVPTGVEECLPLPTQGRQAFAQSPDAGRPESMPASGRNRMPAPTAWKAKGDVVSP